MTDIELTLSTLIYGGDAMGRLADGRAIFVPYALAGETVRARIVEEKRGHVRAELLQVLEASPLRMTPRCPHYFTPPSDGNGEESSTPRACGGCHYQHLSYESQLAVKSAIIKEQLERLGGLKDPVVKPIVPAPAPWNYRNHVQFHLTPEGQLGFEAFRSNTVIPIRECHLPDPTLNEIWPQLDIAPIPGLARVALRLGADDEVMLALETDGSEAVDFVVEDLSLSAVQLGPGGALVLAGSDHLLMEVLGRSFRVSASSFFQVNTRMAERMVEYLLAHLQVSPSTTLLDVYCGVGLFSAFLAPHVRRLIGVEQSPSACVDFTVNLDEFEHVELYEAAAELALPVLDVKPDVVVVDPPRAGIDRRALDAILTMAPGRLAYISCDPATLARDARRLVQAGYQLEQVTPFDLFPQTYHIESISFFYR